MSTHLDESLDRAYASFRQDHDALRSALIASLPEGATQERRPGVVMRLCRFTGRFAVNGRIARLAAAALIITAILLSTVFFDKSVPSVYAIGQTIEANRTMRYLHLRYFDSSHEDVAKECWLEFNEAGQPTNVRINWSEWMAGGEIVVWNQDETQILNKKRDFLIRFNDEIYTARVLATARRENPRLIVERLQERQAKDEVEIEIEQAAGKTGPITVTATGLGGNAKRLVLSVDQTTNLVTNLRWYQLEDGEYKYQGVMEYRDYNVPIGAKMFRLDDEIPSDIEIIDTRVQDIGLPQGDRSDEEIATEVVREFLEALIVKDYAKAAIISGILPPERIEQGWGRLQVVGIVSIDQPTLAAKPSQLFPNRQNVGCTLEVRNDAKETPRQFKSSITVRPVLGRRERWGFD